MLSHIATQLADMFLTMDGRLIEVPYKEGQDLDISGLMEAKLRREELTTERCAMLATFQPGTLADLKVMEVGHFGRTNANAQLVALAVITQDDLGTSMAEIYYTYDPQTFPTQVFRNEDEARVWIAERLA